MPTDSTCRCSWCRSGASGSSNRAWTASKIARAAAGRGRFPPVVVVAVKALACELPAESGVPLSRWSAPELVVEAVARGVVESISASTVRRRLACDALETLAAP